jgi:predicted GIY-YIG superfamily endonuclease
MEKTYCVYILTNPRNTILYTGVTGDLRARIHQHREKLLPGFSQRYNLTKLVYYEAGNDAAAAMARSLRRTMTRDCFVAAFLAMTSQDCHCEGSEAICRARGTD